MMTAEFLVEEPSAEEALRHILPKLVNPPTKWAVRNLGSKHKLLNVLEKRLRAYSTRIGDGENLRIVVLVDRDADDCARLKAGLEQAARQAGLATKSNPAANGRFVVLNRVVVEELESWFLGDALALRKAFPSLPSINTSASPFRNPDNGGSWEVLHRFLKKRGIYRNGYPKIEAARKIAPHLDLLANKSPSFQQFRSGLIALISQ